MATLACVAAAAAAAAAVATLARLVAAVAVEVAVEEAAADRGMAAVADMAVRADSRRRAARDRAIEGKRRR